MTTHQNKPYTPREVKIIPSLVIGLGGTGVGTIRHLKRRVRLDWAGGVHHPTPEMIQFLGVDSVSYGNRPEQEYLSPDEYAFIGGFDPQELVSNPQRYPSIRSWWDFDPGMLPAGLVHLGARQIRALGRLALYYAFPDVWSRVEAKIQQISTIGAANQAMRNGFNVPIEKSVRHIYIVSSLCGGTGSGAFLDLTARIRAAYGAQVVIIGILVLPSAFRHTLASNRQRSRTQANSFAAMKELDAYWYSEHAPPGRTPFSTHFPGDPQPTTLSHGLFNEIYLIGGEGRGRSLSSLDDITQQIGHFLYLTSIHNIAGPLGEGTVNFDRTRKFYSSFAVGALSLPERKLSDGVRYRLQSRYLRNLIHDRRAKTQSGALSDAIIDYLNTLNAEARKIVGNLNWDAGSTAFDNRALAYREERSQHLLRWLFGTIIPQYGLRAVIDVVAGFEDERDTTQEDLQQLYKRMEKAEKGLSRAQSRHVLGRVSEWFYRFTGGRGAAVHQRVLDEVHAKLPPLLVLTSADSNSRSGRLLDHMIALLRPLQARINVFIGQAERVAAQLEQDSLTAQARPAHVAGNGSDGSEYRYYDLEQDPTLPGQEQSFDALWNRVVSEGNLNDLVSPDTTLAPGGAQSQDTVFPSSVFQLLGLYAGTLQARATGHVAPMSETANYLSPSSGLQLRDLVEDWEIESMVDEIVSPLLAGRVKDSASLMQFFAEPLSHNRKRREEMLRGMREVIHNLFTHVKPFWGTSPYPDENQMEPLPLISLPGDWRANPVSTELFKQYIGNGKQSYQPIQGGNPFRLDMVWIEHAARPHHISEFVRCRTEYERFSKNNNHAQLHLAKAFSGFPDPDDWSTSQQPSASGSSGSQAQPKASGGSGHP
jgi:hypothetical protein